MAVAVVGAVMEGCDDASLKNDFFMGEEDSFLSGDFSFFNGDDLDLSFFSGDVVMGFFLGVTGFDGIFTI